MHRVADHAKRVGERLELSRAEQSGVPAVDVLEMSGDQPGDALRSRVGDARPGAAPVGVTALPRDQTVALQAVDDTCDAARREARLGREVTHPQLSARWSGQPKEHLELG